MKTSSPKTNRKIWLGAAVSFGRDGKVLVATTGRVRVKVGATRVLRSCRNLIKELDTDWFSKPGNSL